NQHLHLPGDLPGDLPGNISHSKIFQYPDRVDLTC
ncbi:MAG: hypothetical protein ACI909_003238, partial [Planctomycetota bacterium]